MADKKLVAVRPAQTILDWVAVSIATGFGSGYLPKAPGTAGTVVGVLIYLLMVPVLHLSLPIYIATTFVIFIIGCLTAHRAGRHFGVIDAGHIVIDEIVGFLITMTASNLSFPAIVVGFALFRLFDVVKIWPATYFDKRVANGFGVVMDDVMAAFYALAIMQILKFLQVL